MNEPNENTAVLPVSVLVFLVTKQAQDAVKERSKSWDLREANEHLRSEARRATDLSYSNSDLQAEVRHLKDQLAKAKSEQAPFPRPKDATTTVNVEDFLRLLFLNNCLSGMTQPETWSETPKINITGIIPKIQLIKEVRQVTGLGLKEAKDLVERATEPKSMGSIGDLIREKLGDKALTAAG